MNETVITIALLVCIALAITLVVEAFLCCIWGVIRLLNAFGGEDW